MVNDNMLILVQGRMGCQSTGNIAHLLDGYQESGKKKKVEVGDGRWEDGDEWSVVSSEQ